MTRAYLGAQAAQEGIRFAEDALRSAEETERTVRARHAQGMVLEADLARAVAFRASAEADHAAAAQRLVSARTALVMLVGEAAEGAELTTQIASSAERSAQVDGSSSATGPSELAPPRPLRPPSHTEPEALAQAPNAEGAATPAKPDPALAPDLLTRPDLRAARQRSEAAQAGIALAAAPLLPQVMAQASVETMRSAPDQGAIWFSAALVARWDLSFGTSHLKRAAEARAAAATAALRWGERQARREILEAREAMAAAGSRVASARQAIAASELARTQRHARHRQGLTPLTDVLDADAGLAGARALWLRSLYEARVARAELALALGEPVEGVEP